jgi:hypothetical protein
MTPTEILGLAITLLGLITGLEIRIRSLVKQYLIELKPNSGSSIKDKIDKLESRQSGIKEEISDIKTMLNTIVSKL